MIKRIENLANDYSSEEIEKLKLVRGINCDHFEFFDLKEYLITNMYTEEKLFDNSYDS